MVNAEIKVIVDAYNALTPWQRYDALEILRYRIDGVPDKKTREMLHEAVDLLQGDLIVMEI